MTQDYRSTVFLPQTSFPMRGNLPVKELEILQFWDEINLIQKQREVRQGCDTFILHDGPPYANGHLHIGHAFNKVLKDIVNRFQFMLGKDVVFVPGWDCHGLPIEAKVEEQFRKEGKKKRDMDPAMFRKACRAYAEEWVGVQRDEFQRLGLMGDWSTPYTTMAFASEAAIVEAFLKLFEQGYVIRGEKPVMWSPTEATALAEAEIEYKDVTSPAIYVRFPVVETAVPDLQESAVVIWTTTPWTLPGNRAVAYGASMDYVLICVDEIGEDAHAREGDRLVVAQACLARFLEETQITAHRILGTWKGEALAGTLVRHPLFEKGYDFKVPLLAGEHVTSDAGTGLVHTAPGHGVEDFLLGKEHGLEVPKTVDGEGLFDETLPLVGGQHVYKVNPLVIDALREGGSLLASQDIVHSYPHSWRSKKPLIYRTTPQWFIQMDGETNLRDKALKAIKAVTWYPREGENRITDMIAKCPDWCLSRQRSWGVPLTLFLHKETRKPLLDEAVNARILEVITQEGTDAWWGRLASDFLGPDYDPSLYEKVVDILDVWFDSGTTHHYVLKAPPLSTFPADLYLEGSDQHRGWFHSSLLTACGLEGYAPYRTVLTHGFCVDEQGHKMSKSLGNTVAPQKIISQKGADLLRLWVASTDFSEDMRIGPEILRRLEDIYRRFRNTFRYLLGATTGCSDLDLSRIKPADFPDLEQWIFHRLYEIDRAIRTYVGQYQFQKILQEIHHFCAVDLSSFYFDVRKDALYCDAPDAPLHKAARECMTLILGCLTRWLAPFLSFTTEEVWQARLGDEGEKAQGESIHLSAFWAIPPTWDNTSLATGMEALRTLRRVITGALEQARQDRRIGSSLQAQVILFIEDPERFGPEISEEVLNELCITSSSVVNHGSVPERAYRLDEVEQVGVEVRLAPGEKCERCWKVLETVGDTLPGLCPRCASVVRKGSK